jgi:hypothetical protein
MHRGDGCGTVFKLTPAAATTTTLTSSPNPSTYGQAVTFTAAVTSKLGAPPDGETVSFMKGTTVLGTGTLSGGSASFTTSTLKVGTNDIKAVFSGDSFFAGSKSKAVSQVVEKATTTTTLGLFAKTDCFADTHWSLVSRRFFNLGSSERRGYVFPDFEHRFFQRRKDSEEVHMRRT